jgi:hypothetical protein
MAQDDDSFGLPDLNYKPLEPKPETPPATPPKVEKKPEVKAPAGRIQTPGMPAKAVAKPKQEEEKTTSSVVVGILVPILILVGGYFAYVYLYKKPKEKMAIEAANKIRLDKEKKAKEEAARLAKLKEEEEARLRDAANARPAVGTIETLSARTGRWYIIAASSIDGDLIMDEAQRMSAKGVSTKIIPPFGKWKFYRLTVSDEESFALAQSKADESKAEFGNGLWVMKY